MAENVMTSSIPGKVAQPPVPGSPPGAMSLIDQFFVFLSSLKLAVSLILLVAALSIAGTLIVQAPLAEPGQIEATYLPATVKLFTMLGFFDVYHSLWFTTVLALLGLNLIFCTIDLFPRTAEFVKRPKLDASEHYIQGQQCKNNFATDLSGEEMTQRIEHVLRRQGLKPQYNTYPDRSVFFAQTGLWWRFTVYFIHAALLVIFTGGIITARFGFTGFLWSTTLSVPRLAEGERTTKFARQTENGIKEFSLGFDLVCRGTTVEFRKDLPGFIGDPLSVDDVTSVGKVHRWTSHMSVLENGKEAFQYDIIVNEPLIYRGLRIYQASFGITADFKKLGLLVKKDGAPDAEAVKFEMGPDESVKVPGTDLTATVKKFIPDPALDPNTGQPTSRSKEYYDPRYDAPVARLELKKPDGTTDERWALYNPESTWSVLDRRGGNPLGYVFALSSITPRYWTGLQVSHSPGYETFVVGGIMILAALILRFFFSHRRYWVSIKKNPEGHQIYVGANTSRHKITIEKKFNQIVADLKTALEAET